MQSDADLSRIIEKCKKADADAFAKLVDIYAERCYGYFFRLTSDESVSEDLLSELFIKLIEKIGTCRTETFEPWLFKTASNVFHDYLRDKYRREKFQQAHRKDIYAAGSGQKRSDAELFDELQFQLDRLDSETRELIVLRYYSDLSFKALGRLVGAPTGTVLSKVHRGLKKLREQMQPEKEAKHNGQ